jgi:AraC-like DNA-binding protein
MAPLEYVHTLRLEEAKQMLEATDAPIETIASEIGYEDAGFFARLFRRAVGITPGQYRRRFGAMRRVLDFDRTSPAGDDKEPRRPPKVGQQTINDRARRIS